VTYPGHKANQLFDSHIQRKFQGEHSNTSRDLRKDEFQTFCPQRLRREKLASSEAYVRDVFVELELRGWVGGACLR
jgi:hypothetical protein